MGTVVVERRVVRRHMPFGRRSQHRWVEHLASGVDEVVITYTDLGVKKARVPWVAYEATGTLGGFEVELSGPYVAEPNWWRREALDLAPDVHALPRGRAEMVVEHGGTSLLVRAAGRSSEIVDERQRVVAALPFAYASFRMEAVARSAEEVVALAAIVGSGLYRMVQRGRMLDDALFGVASPFKEKPRGQRRQDT